MSATQGNYHEGRDDATGEIQWDDRTRELLAKARWGQPSTQIDNFLEAMKDLSIGKLATLFDLPPKVQQFIKPFAHIRVIDILRHDLKGFHWRNRL